MNLKSEDQFLELIDQCFPRADRRIILGRGDDAAILACPGRITLTTDLFLEDEHFRRGYFEPEDIGHKALAANLSDLAAMGARPLGFCLGLMAPPEVSGEYWRRLFQGMSALARRFDCPLVGGDISRADRIGLSIAAWGEPAGEGETRFLTRTGARPGDAIVALLPANGLGLARAGLLALEQALKTGNTKAVEKVKRRHPAATGAHLRPEPLVEQGQVLARIPEVLACMDLSDGLARDLPRLLGHGYTAITPDGRPQVSGGLGASIQIEASELHPELLTIAHELDLDPLETAILGGEDYGLLGVASDASALANLPGLLVLGKVTAGTTIEINGLDWEGRGFDHFRK